MDPEYITADVSDNHDVAILNTDDYEYFSWENMKLVAKPCNIYDGDTFSACWYYGNKVIKYRCRCLGYDSPEMRPRLNLEGRDEVKLNALKAKERFTELLEQDSTITLDCKEFDKYGRVLVNVYNATNGDKSLNDIMVEEEFGYAYFGGTKR
mgnify:FL=1